MNPLRLHLIAVLFAPLLRAQAPPNDPVGSKLFAPEFIGANAEMISLSESQREKLRAAVEQAQPRFAELGPRLKEAVEGLGKLIEQNAADRAAIVAQSEKIQDCERDLKRAQLDLLLDLRGMLNEEQRTWLTQLKAQQAGQFRERGERAKAAAAKLRQVDSIVAEALKLIESALPPDKGAPPQAQQIQEKAERVQAGAEKWQGEGRDPAPIAEIMQQVGPLMNAGKVQEASALLDRALKILESGGK